MKSLDKFVPVLSGSANWLVSESQKLNFMNLHSVRTKCSLFCSPARLRNASRRQHQVLNPSFVASYISPRYLRCKYVYNSAVSYGITSCFLRTFCSNSSSEKDKNTPKLLSISPHEFADYLKANKLNRCFLIWSDSEQRVVASHSELKEIEDWLNDPSNAHYRKHEAIFFSLGIRTGSLLSAFLWKINRGQACGGIRMSPYSSMESFLSDGLRLSRRLGVKSALAGLWIGGGKGIIPDPKDKQHMNPDYRSKLFYDYGDFVSSLNGCYIAGMDIGVNTYDLYNVHSRTRWAVCGPEDIGGSGNAARYLAEGVLCGMEAALSFLGVGGFTGLKIAVQGAGGIGLALTSRLLDHGVSHVYVTDASQKRVGDLYDMLVPKARGRLKVDKVPLGDLSILSYDCDILSPCAIGHVLKPDTITEIRAKIICGSANSLLAKEEYGKLIDEMNITYVLEYLPNRMALVNSVYENYGRLFKDPLISRHFNFEWEHSIFVMTKRVLQMASHQNIPVVEAATQLAEMYSEQTHPLWPGRTKAIIQDLLAHQWHHGSDFWRKRHNFAKAESCA